MEVFDSTWEGKFYSDPSHYEELESLYLQKLIDKSTGKVLINTSIIDKCTNEKDLILSLKSHFKWKPIPEAIKTRFDKSSKLSTILRERANESYKTGNASRALRGYNLSVAFAPIGSPELGLAFGNRSALFFQIKEFSLAIQDIDLALRNNFPDNLKEKLLQRKEKCEILLKSQKKTQDLSKIEEVEEFCEENFFRIKNHNKNIPNAEDWVQVDFQEDRGRRVVTTKDVPAGTLILIDKPFVSMINNLLTWDLQHCHFCSKSLLGGIPCELCTFTLYCNEDCLNKSCLGNHQYEHNFLSVLHSISLSSHKEIQSLRLMGYLGPEKLFGYFKNPESLSQPPPGKISGFDPTSQIYDCNSYLPIYHLISHGMNAPITEKIADTFKAIYFTKLLKETSNFFQKISKKTPSPEELESFEDFITSLVYRHMSNLRYNAISISKLKTTASGEISLSYATAMYPLVSLCNHSCDPNAVPVKKFELLETSLITIKSLKAGDEIFITYKPLFPQMKTKERQAYLKEFYNFVCQCQACVKDWSLKSIKPTDKIHEVPQSCAKCFKNGILFKPCEECVKGQLVKIAVLDGFESQLYDVDDSLKKGEFIKAVNNLKVCLDYFTQNHSSCYSLTQVAAELFKRALVRVMNQWQFNR